MKENCWSYCEIRRSLSSDRIFRHERVNYVKQKKIRVKKLGCDFGCDFCPFLSTFVHSYKQQRPPKLAAFALKILKLALYARRDLGSGGQRRPLYESLFLLSLKAFLFFSGAIWVRKCRRKVS